MRLLRRFLLRDLGLKLLALAISFVLWASYTSEPIADTGYNVPVAFINVPAGFTVAGDAPTAVHVRLRGRPPLLRRLDARDLSVTVDMARATAGEVPVQLTPAMVEAPYGTQVVLMTPAQFRVTLVLSPTPAAGPG